MKNNRLVISFFILVSFSLRGQDPFFSVSNGLLYENPTAHTNVLTEKDRKGMVNLTYRDQWRSLSDPSFSSFMLESAFIPYKSSVDNWLIGATFLNDKSNGGVLNNNLAQLHTAYQRKFAGGFRSYHKISFGASFSYQRTNLTSQDLWFGRQYDMSNLQIDRTVSNGESFNLESSGFASLSLGLSWKFKMNTTTSLNSSVALHHLNKPEYGFNESKESLSRRINFDIVFTTALNRHIDHGAFLKVIDQQPSRQLTAGYHISFGMNREDSSGLDASIATRLINSISGTSFESLIFSLGIEKAKWRGSMSYDLNISSLNYFTRGNGALEISLAYYLVRD